MISKAKFSNTSSIQTLVRSFEAEARVGGANKIILNGIDIIETKLINAPVAQRLGYKFERTGNNSIRLTKILN